MKIKTLPNGNMNLEGIEFVSETGIHVMVREYAKSDSGKDCHWLTWRDENGNIQNHKFEYSSIVDCFAKKVWRIKLIGKPVKIMKRLTF